MNIEATQFYSKDDDGEIVGQRFSFEVRHNQTGDENLNDFHAFCFSIVRDVISKKFKTNEHGHINYDFAQLNQEDIQETLKNISIMTDTIFMEKLIFLKELNDIKNNLNEK